MARRAYDPIFGQLVPQLCSTYPVFVVFKVAPACDSSVAPILSLLTLNQSGTGSGSSGEIESFVFNANY